MKHGFIDSKRKASKSVEQIILKQNQYHAGDDQGEGRVDSKRLTNHYSLVNKHKKNVKPTHSIKILPRCSAK